MADTEKEKAEKIAAAKKRYEQIKKQKEKGKKAGEKASEKPGAKKKEATKTDTEEELAGTQEKNEEGTSRPADEALEDEKDTIGENEKAKEIETPTRTGHGRQPSLSIQSKMRSASFRRTSGGDTPASPPANGAKGFGLPPLSPEGDTVQEIYRKQASRIEELEKENKRLAREAETADARQRRTEEELEELRENASHIAELKSRAEKGDAMSEEMNRIKSELTSLQRQNAHLQSQKGSRHTISPSQANITLPSDLAAQLDSKSSTIESMELEISNLRAQLSKSSSSSDSHVAQVAALEEKLARAERAAGAAQRELQDVKKNLERASAKALKEGTERSSAETKIRTLSREAEQSGKAAEEAARRAETLEKKLGALTTLHKEADARRQVGERERERLEREAGELRRRVAGLESENARLREERQRLKLLRDGGAGGGTDDEGLDELEDEERKKLEARVRELEGELSEVRHGAWQRERRRMMGGSDEHAVTSPGTEFDEIDLMGTGNYNINATKKNSTQARTSSFATVLTSGLNAFAGVGVGGGTERSNSLDLVRGPDDGDLLNDDDMAFDEDAFRAAQAEDALRRVERVKEVKRGLKEWSGFRIDLVDLRMLSGSGAGSGFGVGGGGGGAGLGEIFDI